MGAAGSTSAQQSVTGGGEIGDNTLSDAISQGLLRNFDACDVTNYKDLKAVEQKTASNSQIIFANIVVRGQHFPIVIKAFLEDPTDNSLSAEANVYVKYIHKFITGKICPFFINVVKYAKCPGLLGLIDKLPTVSSGNKRVIQEGLSRIVSEVQSHGVRLPAVPPSQWAINLLLLEQATSSSTFYDFLNGPDFTEQRFSLLLVQLFYALFVMKHYGVVHNDLHQGNMFVTNLKSKQLLLLALGPTCDKMFLMYTSRILKIYDFDRATAPGIQNSVLLPSSERCIEFGECDVGNYKRDLFLVLCSLRTTSKLRKLDWLHQLISRVVSDHLFDMQLAIGKSSGATCRLRSPDPNVGPFIPPDTADKSQYWMKSVDEVISTDPFFTSKTMQAVGECTLQTLLQVDSNNIYAVTPEIRLQIINQIERNRTDKASNTTASGRGHGTWVNQSQNS